MQEMGFKGLVGYVLVVFLFSGCNGTRPSKLGVRDGQLMPCPSSPNCVSSQSGDERHRIEPIPYTSTPAEAMAKLKKVVQGMKRTTLVRETPNYIHVEFRTILGFVDEGEFYLSARERLIHLRSASRVGYWDLGVNRRRMEVLRTAFEKN